MKNTLVCDGENVTLPAHDVMVCGLFWDSTCLACLLAWQNHREWMSAEVPDDVAIQLAEMSTSAAVVSGGGL